MSPLVPSFEIKHRPPLSKEERLERIRIQQELAKRALADWQKDEDEKMFRAYREIIWESMRSEGKLMIGKDERREE